MSSDPFHWQRNPIGLYRDVRNAKIAGVCAGIADWLDIRVGVVRTLAILAAIFGFFPFVVGVYILLAVVLKPKPEVTFRSEAEERFWRTMSAAPGRTVNELSQRFRTLDRRLADIERAVTSHEFDLRRQFRDLGA